ncbi:unnamed protein product [Owenia fusiformis]|uniref:Uncharacterized protein n=1 Tax=Owenia fusiformis TaxID=6347 RepID=A0A8J1UZS1_OWEFU|nr:unnamed protein product [Owenia fusiformis]
MAVSSVHLQSDAYLVCLTHALSTEREEIMGLLIGEIDENRVSHVSAVVVLRRSDKQPDRVEISPEQLSAAASQAEMLGQELKRPMRVLGWYHSHPHITVWPSHVDCRTQAMYQMLDEGFIGLIFSVFNDDKNSKKSTCQVTCFQSTNQSPEGEPPQYTRIEVPLHIVPRYSIETPCLNSLIQLPQILCQEEQEAYEKTLSHDLDLLTRLHNGAVYSKSLCGILEVMGAPTMQALESRQQRNKQKIQQLQQEKEKLLRLLKPKVRTPTKTTRI